MFYVYFCCIVDDCVPISPCAIAQSCVDTVEGYVCGPKIENISIVTFNTVTGGEVFTFDIQSIYN